jgi:hypothetical protein
VRINLQVGYDVAVEHVRQVSAAVAAAGNNGSISSMFYAEVRLNPKTSIVAAWPSSAVSSLFYAEVRLVSQCWVVAGNTLLLTVTSPINSTPNPVQCFYQDTVPAPLWQAQHCFLCGYLGGGA